MTIEISVAPNSTNLEELIAIWAKVWSREQGSKSGHQWVTYSQSEANEKLHRRFRPNSRYYGSHCYLTVTPTENEPAEIIPQQSQNESQKVINRVITEEHNALNEAYELVVDMQNIWKSQKTESENYTRRLNLGSGLNIGNMVIGTLSASVNLGLERTRTQTNLEEQQNTRNFKRTYKCPAGYKTAIKIIYSEKKVTSIARCPVKLSGHILICCDNKVSYAGDTLIKSQQGEKHKKWAVPIGQVFQDLLNYLINNNPLLTDEDKILLRKIRDDKLLQARTELTEVNFTLDTTVQHTELVNAKAEAKPVPLAGQHDAPATIVIENSNDKSHEHSVGKKLYLAAKVEGDYADLFIMDGGTSDLSVVEQQQLLEQIGAIGSGGEIYRSQVIAGKHARIRQIPKSGIDETSAELAFVLSNMPHPALQQQRDHLSAQAAAKGSSFLSSATASSSSAAALQNPQEAPQEGPAM